MRLDKFTIKAQEALAAAQAEAEKHATRRSRPSMCCGASDPRRRRGPAVLRKVGAESRGLVRKLDEALGGANAGSRRHGPRPTLGRRMKDLLDEAARQSDEFKDEYVSSEHLLLALLSKDLGASFARTARGGAWRPRHGSQSPGRRYAVASGSPTRTPNSATNRWPKYTRAI